MASYEDLDLTHRVAGCLVLLYGQQLTRIVAITRDQLSIADDAARLRLGATHVEIPEPLRGLLARLASDGRRYVGVGSPPATPWLFPGHSPGRMHTYQHLLPGMSDAAHQFAALLAAPSR